jgi:hypothetical protein
VFKELATAFVEVMLNKNSADDATLWLECCRSTWLPQRRPPHARVSLVGLGGRTVLGRTELPARPGSNGALTMGLGKLLGLAIGGDAALVAMIS